MTHMAQEIVSTDAIADKYQGDKSGLIQILLEIQRQNRWLSEDDLKSVSRKLGVPLAQIYHVATFYKAFSLTRQGRVIVKVCMGTACYVKGADHVLATLESLLHIKAGETTPDGKVYWMGDEPKTDTARKELIEQQAQRDAAMVKSQIAGLEQSQARLVERLAADGVSFRADAKAYVIVGEPFAAHVQPAGPEDFDTEWLSLVLGLKVVAGIDEAIEHIARHSTAHSDGILTENAENAAAFVEQVDSAAVYVNASTRFTDGAQFGLGAEIAVSTQRLHARGPMGLAELTTYKWVVQGDYHVRP